MDNQYILILDGMTGAGKTTTTKLLKEKISRTAIIGFDKIKWFISDFERSLRDNAIAKDVVEAMARVYLGHNLSVIIEHACVDSEVARYEKLAKEKNLSLYKVQLYTNPEEAFRRVVERQKDIENKVPEERILRNISLFKNRESEGFTTIDTTITSPEEVVEIILSLVQENQA